MEHEIRPRIQWHEEVLLAREPAQPTLVEDAEPQHRPPILIDELNSELFAFVDMENLRDSIVERRHFVRN